MKLQNAATIILMALIATAFFSCDGITLFHGPKPEPEPVTYTVTFDANTGATGTPPETMTVKEGALISLPDKGNMAKGRDELAGWSESRSGGDSNYSIGASVAVTKNMVFFAQWFNVNTPKYKVSFDVNGGASGANPPQPQTAYSGFSITLPGQGSISHSTKKFGGWNTQDNGGGSNYASGAAYTYTVPTGTTGQTEITLYARWQSEVQYTVTYDANGASGTVPTAHTVDPGTVITLPERGNLTASGKVFSGWNTLANGGGVSHAEGAAYTVNGNVVLYAQWANQYTVTYHANGATGGTAPLAQTVDPGTVITLSGRGSLTASGRTFSGWNTLANGSGASYAEGAAYTVNGDVGFYAQWVSAPIDPNAIIPPGSTLAEKLAYIRNDMSDGAVFDIVVSGDVYMGPQTVSTMGRNVTVYLRSANSADVKSVQLDGQGHLLSVDTAITLKLHDIVLKGTSTNNRALVAVGGGGTLVLNSGSKITSNTSTSSGGGVLVNGGVLEMNDGSEIIQNRAGNNGGGIIVENSANVSIRGGLISENRAVRGGGIYISTNSAVNMTGGIISKNEVRDGSFINPGFGGGIYVASSNSTFTKRAASGSTTSGIIFGGTGSDANTTTWEGHAIHRYWGTLRNRNTTLGGYDEISTLNDVGWEE